MRRLTGLPPFAPRNGSRRRADGSVVREPIRKDGRKKEGGAAQQPYPLIAHDADVLLATPVPERRWHVGEWLPAADVTLLGADGGEGKTTLAIQLARTLHSARLLVARQIR